MAKLPKQHNQCGGAQTPIILEEDFDCMDVMRICQITVALFLILMG